MFICYHYYLLYFLYDSLRFTLQILKRILISYFEKDCANKIVIEYDLIIYHKISK